MTQQDFVLACQAAFDQNRLSCSEEQAEKLFLLTERMLTVNKTMNLTAITDEKQVILKHYVDSAMLSAYLPDGASVMDVGCGAGFPTLPLAIIRPDLSITALDGTAKRIRYVEETAAMLGLSNVTAIAGRAEEYGNNGNYREKYDVVTARAVANLQVLCELCLPFARVGGKLISMKSQTAEEEARAAAHCIAVCGGKSDEILSCDLIDWDGCREQRNLVLIRKVSSTPKNYPRHFSKISKKPL